MDPHRVGSKADPGPRTAADQPTMTPSSSGTLGLYSWEGPGGPSAVSDQRSQLCFELGGDLHPVLDLGVWPYLLQDLLRRLPFHNSVAVEPGVSAVQNLRHAG